MFIALARAFKFIDDWVRPRLASHQLAITEFAVLEVLYHKGPIPLGELSKRILVTGASTNYVVKKLEERGLMSRTACEQDKRVVLAELTDAGRVLIEKVFPLHAGDLEVALSGLSTSEKRSVTRLLRKLRKSARLTDASLSTENI